MKKILFFLFILVISNSLCIFFYGLSQQFKAAGYEKKVRQELFFDSAFIKAVHGYEDAGRPNFIDGSSSVYGWNFKYVIRELENSHLYINIIGQKKGKNIKKELLVNKKLSF